MLIEFSVENFRSIREEQRFSMVATAASDHEATHVAGNVAPGVDRVLRSAVIYGANAAGKSNVLLALDVMSDVVTESAGDEQGKVLEQLVPYCLDNDKCHQPTKFEAVFVEDGVKYQYGFIANARQIIEEWLYSFPEKRSQEWFYRTTDADGKVSSKFGAYLKGRKSVWGDATRPNALLLSTAVHLNADMLQPVYRFFRSKLRVVMSGELNHNFSTTQLSDPEFSSQIVKFLAAADTGVQGIEAREGKSPNKTQVEIFNTIQDSELKEQLIKQASTEISVRHIRDDGSDVWIDLDDESKGTKKLFSFAGPILDTLKNGFVLAVDELNNSLHPLIVREIVKAFHEPTVNTGNAQLIFVTHASSMLDLELFRRDQIWFVEKDSSSGSRLYPLTDFSPRKDVSLERGYLRGRYGAIPFLSQAIL